MLTGDLRAWDPNVRATKDGILRLDDLEISFNRTVRVPDNTKTNGLPPSLGRFPLFEVGKHAKTLPDSMVKKGGAFFPMYQREAMWIDFSSTRTYAIKIYSGDTNVISGEPIVETDATLRRRRNLLQQGKSIQDFVVVPEQHYLDGIAVAPGKVRQFVAMPLGSGYSVDAQLTGEETTGGLRFEITRLDDIYPPGIGPEITITVDDDKYQGRFTVRETTRVGTVLEAFLERKQRAGQPISWNVRLLHEDSRLLEHEPLCDAGVTDGAVLIVHQEVYGGGCDDQLPPEMILAAGGVIEQAIVELPNRDYRKTVTLELNVQIVNASNFQSVTGRPPPATPVTAETYISLGLPFYSMWKEEPTTVSGPPFGIKSIGQIDGKIDAPLRDVSVIDLTTGEIQTDWKCTECLAVNSGGMKHCDVCGKASHQSDGGSENGSGEINAANRVGMLYCNRFVAPWMFPWEMAEKLGAEV